MIKDEGWVRDFKWGESGYTTSVPSGIYSLTDSNENLDWGVYNAISNGGNQPNQWRTLQYSEWNYLIHRNHDKMWTTAILHENDDRMKFAIILFPDNYMPIDVQHYRLGDDNNYLHVPFSTWDVWKKHGAIAFMAEDYSSQTSICRTISKYWTATYGVSGGWCYFTYRMNYNSPSTGIYGDYFSSVGNDKTANLRCRVRLVKNVQ